MVSVVSSVLSQTLWRVLGGDPHHPWLGGRRSPLSVTHNGRQQQPQRHALACCGGGHVSEAGVCCEAGEPGAWVLLDPLTPAAAPAPSLAELCAPACRAEAQQEECGRPSPDIAPQGQPAPALTPAEPRVSPPQSHEAASGDEEFCCVATQPCVTPAGEEHPPGVTQHDQEAAVAGSAAAAGSSAGSGRARWWRRRRRQFVERRRPEQLSCAPSRHCPSCHAAHTMDCPSGTSAPPLRAAPPPSCPPQRGPASPAAPYNEDIRDFDIYKIIRKGEEGQYPRLPALPTQSDSDTDDSTAGTHEALRRRKRRNPERRVAGRKKLHREEEENTRVEADMATRLLAPPLHRGTTTTHPATPPRPTTLPPCPSPATLGHCRVGGSWDEGVGSDRSDEEDEDEDDDETSTVVPDDFANDTDSDIEVLIQSACSSESWVDLSNQPGSPDRVTPLPFGNGEEYLRLLREAQRESNQSSARVSLASSRRDTPRDSPHDSPKSPPNSPNTEMATDPEEASVLRGVYINYYNKEGDFIRVEKNTETDWIWDWSSRPDQTPPKEWRFSHPRKGVSRGASIRRVMVGNSSLFSRDVLYTLLITNVLSLIIGTGIGIWLVKRSGSEGITTLPLN
ncbi:uncharacterized protein LOC126998835 isoform X2 [Eriocheir sinensis]|uniref:uncharacterized protein LOC126998835 isoform X2 n=1 Tax=Eriocheir sinensis TaxID=95602 RepID=UPI0021C6753A|nr:uncharacterized protein LOC126998835 isoform X2 [Eriocheir sinensis]